MSLYLFNSRNYSCFFLHLPGAFYLPFIWPSCLFFFNFYETSGSDSAGFYFIYIAGFLSVFQGYVVELAFLGTLQLLFEETFSLVCEHLHMALPGTRWQSHDGPSYVKSFFFLFTTPARELTLQFTTQNQGKELKIGFLRRAFLACFLSTHSKQVLF